MEAGKNPAKEWIGRWGDCFDDDDEDRTSRELLPGRGLGPDEIGDGLDRPLSPRFVGLDHLVAPRLVTSDLPLFPRTGLVRDEIDDGLHRPLAPRFVGLDLPLVPRLGHDTDEIDDGLQRPLAPRFVGLDLPLVPRLGHDTDEIDDGLQRPLVPRRVLGLDEEDDRRLLPPRIVVGPDEEGFKTTVDFYYNELGQKVKVTTTTRTRMVPTLLHTRVAAAVERRSWARFGDAAEDGDASSVTMVSQEHIRFPDLSSPGSVAASARGIGVYIPPKRTPCKMPGSSQQKVAVRVTNLTPYADEKDVSDLFTFFGRLRGVSIAWDSKTGRSKGIAIVNYYNKGDAERAIAALDGYRYGYMIL